MTGIVDTLAALWGGIEKRDAKIILGRQIESDRVDPATVGSEKFAAGKHYFVATINEMFLARDREWFTVYDPMALVVCEFIYGGKKIVSPYVVGPTTLQHAMKEIPEGFTISDTKVAGVSPYAGGTFSLSIILAKVRRRSYAKDLLTFLETASNAFPAGVALQPHLKVAGAVLDGVQSLFGMNDDVKPVIGHRWEFNPGTTPWYKAGFFAMVNRDEALVPYDRLRVVDGRLRYGLGRDAPGYRDSDFLLYSVSFPQVRDDVTELPFHGLFTSALPQAGSVEDGAWDRAKAGLVTLYQEMLSSPDLIWDQTQGLIDEYKAKLLEARAKALAFKVMSDKKGEPVVATNLENPESLNQQVDADARANSLRGAQKLLKLEVSPASQ